MMTGKHDTGGGLTAPERDVDPAAPLDRDALPATAVDHALEQLVLAVGHLVKVVEDGGLDAFDAGELVGFVQSFERVRNRLALVDHRVIGDGERRGLPGVLVQRSMRQVLVSVLRLSPGEAARRVTAAAACAERVSVVGEVLEPARPLLAAAQREGVVSAEQVDIVARALARVDRAGFDPAEIAAGEELLVGFAATFGAKDLRQLAERTVDAIDPDGSVPDDQLCQDRRHFSWRRCRDGMVAGEFRLTGAVGAKLTALLQPLSRPRLHPQLDPHPTTAHPTTAHPNTAASRDPDTGLGAAGGAVGSADLRAAKPRRGRGAVRPDLARR
jgi:hypothetical protein